jgi:hypothetical protein
MRPIAAELGGMAIALESAGVEFMDDACSNAGGGPGVRLHKGGATTATIPLEDLNAENDE